MKKEHKLLLLIFLVVLGFRLYFAFQIENFSGDDAYFNVRHTEYINLHLTPLVNDELSYGGRTIINSHVFHYFLSFFNAFNPTLAFKIIPELLLALLVVIVYFIAESITKNPLASLLSAFSSGFIPILMTETLNNVSIYCVILPLFAYQFYCVLNLSEKLNHFIVLSFILPLVHPIGFLLDVMLIVYLVLLELDYTTPEPLTREAILFSTLSGLLLNMIIYKKVLLASGLSVIWQNIPEQLLSSYFKGFNVFDIMLNIGIVLLIFGIIGLLIGIYRQKSRIIYLLSAMIITTFILLFLKMINFQVGIMFLGLLIAIVSSMGFDRFMKYIELTKFSKAKPLILISLVVLMVLTTALPSYFAADAVIKNTITNNEIEALNWVKDNTPEDTTVLADVEEGNYITYFAKRKNVIDSFFLSAPNRYDDVQKVFGTQSVVEALQILDKYDVGYIYISKRTYDKNYAGTVKFLTDECFSERYSNEYATVYKILC